MKNLNKLFLTIALAFSFVLVAQENTDGEPTTIQGLLQLVEEGRTSEQTVNAQREADFLANKNQQAAKLAREKRELARQEKIADELETEYKKNDAILFNGGKSFNFNFSPFFGNGRIHSGSELQSSKEAGKRGTSGGRELKAQGRYF